MEGTAYTKEAPMWAIDRRVPLAVIVTILLQSAAALLWAGAANERLQHLEERTERIGELVERTARLEEQAKAANAALGRIEERLGRRGGPQNNTSPPGPPFKFKEAGGPGRRARSKRLLDCRGKPGNDGCILM